MRTRVRREKNLVSRPSKDGLGRAQHNLVAVGDVVEVLHPVSEKWSLTGSG